MNWYLEVWRKYAQFDGRSRRKEYWLFTLFNTLVIMAIVIVGGLVAGEDPGLNLAVGLAYFVYALAAFIPSIAVTARRLHDTDRSGWWMLISLIPLVGLILIVFLAQDSQPGKNRFGPNPKGTGAFKDDPYGDALA